jgi:hypothetical protein
MKMHAEAVDCAARVTQGLRAGDLLLSRVIALLEEARAGALSSDESDVARELGRAIGELRGQSVLIEDLICARCEEATAADDETHAVLPGS